MILVTGATGFVGREVVKRLLARGHPVRALVHRREGAQGTASDDVEQVYGDVADADSLRAAVAGVQGVVHLVAVIRERGGSTFENVNHQGSRRLAEAAQEAGVRCFVHLSALGAADDPRFPYLRSKWLGEQAVIQSGVPYTVLRASLLFGQGDEFFTTLAGVVKAFPVVPVAGDGRTRFQPLAVEDVAECLAQAVEREELRGRVVEIGGPDYLTYDEMLRLTARTLGVRRWRVHVPLRPMGLLVWAMEKTLPHPPATRHQLSMLAVDSTAKLGEVEGVFGFKPRPVEGNISYVRSLSSRNALRIALGLGAARSRVPR